MTGQGAASHSGYMIPLLSLTGWHPVASFTLPSYSAGGVYVNELHVRFPQSLRFQRFGFRDSLCSLLALCDMSGDLSPYFARYSLIVVNTGKYDTIGKPPLRVLQGAPQAMKRVYVKPEALLNRPRCLKAAMRIRKSVERVFGDVKVWHGMGRARYRGLGQVKVQVLMTLIVANAKKMAKLLAAKGVPRHRA